MEEYDKNLYKVADVGDVDIDIDLLYSDSDVVLIDNVKVLSEPDKAMLNMNAIAVCIKGKIQLDFNGKHLTFSEGQILICPPNSSLSDFMISPDFEFRIVFVSRRMLQTILRDKISVWNELIYLRKEYIIKADEEMLKFMEHFYNFLNLCLTSERLGDYRREIMATFLRAAVIGFYGFMSQLREEMDNEKKLPGHSQIIFRDFLALLDNRPIRQRSVAYYADKLCISPKYLSSVCKHNSGRTAGEWITERVAEDIRHYLSNTDLSIKQICDILCFPNPSFFGKYVKTLFGTTPAKMRRT
ncbi:MAG: AraC family transcriptional regulator [Muribaculaceae bacterium]|nr:AraC family transcriptional regulator [Muribaculaceae bacterium]